MKAALSLVYLTGGAIVCSCQIYTDDLLRSGNLTANSAGSSASPGGASNAQIAAGGSLVTPAVGAPPSAAGSATTDAGAPDRNTVEGGATSASGGSSAAGGELAAGNSGAAGTGLTSPACVADTDCDDSNPCTVDHCDGGGACSATPGNPGAVCRPAVGACDIADTCTGSSATCPANAVLGNGTACDDANASTCNDVCSAGVCAGGTSCSPCSGICSKPVNIDNQSNPSTASPFCYEGTKAMGANAGGVVGKGFEVNGHAVTADGAVPWPAKRYGGYCFKSSAPLDWLSLY